ncbi:MAG TPA: hypothetical protein VMX77_00155, partial [Candidatus Bathyarchaeia archaeon]|nr:hypothetical protein [Candidatus Bathyarchaeia archaeon]
EIKEVIEENGEEKEEEKITPMGMESKKPQKEILNLIHERLTCYHYKLCLYGHRYIKCELLIRFYLYGILSSVLSSFRNHILAEKYWRETFFLEALLIRNEREFHLAYPPLLVEVL